MYYRVNDLTFGDRYDDDEPAVPGDHIMIVDGPFCGFEGKVTDIDELESVAVVVITIFERATTVTVDYREIKKVRF